MALRQQTELKSLFGEVQSLHKWEITVPTWPAAVAPTNRDLLFFVTTSDLPTSEYNDMEIQLGGFKMNYNGNESRKGEITWTFYDNTDGEVLQYFLVDYANQRQLHDLNNGSTLRSRTTADLEADTVIMTLYRADGVTPAKRIILVNVMWQVANIGGQLGQDAEPQQPEIVAQFDSWHYENVSN